MGSNVEPSLDNISTTMDNNVSDFYMQSDEHQGTGTQEEPNETEEDPEEAQEPRGCDKYDDVPRALSANTQSLLDQDDLLVVPSAIEREWTSFYNGREQDVLEYIGGYLIKKLPHCDVHPAMQSSWIDTVSDGGLKTPSKLLVNKLDKLEKVFNDKMGKTVDKEPKIFFRLVNDKTSIEIEPNVKVRKLFFKVRIHARIRALNDKDKKYFNLTTGKQRSTYTYKVCFILFYRSIYRSINPLIRYF